jgi:hypothetical protein
VFLRRWRHAAEKALASGYRNVAGFAEIVERLGLTQEDFPGDLHEWIFCILGAFVEIGVDPFARSPWGSDEDVIYALRKNRACPPGEPTDVLAILHAEGVGCTVESRAIEVLRFATRYRLSKMCERFLWDTRSIGEILDEMKELALHGR